MPLLIPVALMLALVLLRRRPGLVLRLVLLCAALLVLVPVAVLFLVPVLLALGLGGVLLLVVALPVAAGRGGRGRFRSWARLRVRHGWQRRRARWAGSMPWRRPSAPPRDQLATAWEELAHLAPWSVSRVNAARTSVSRLIDAADTQPLAVDLVEWVEVVRRRIPELVGRCAGGVAARPLAQAQAWIDGHLDMIESIAAEADRRVARNRPAGANADLATHRAWLAQHIGVTPLTAV